nr:hypothetical protein StreXyl84_72120 [Streptomyces sp. Xyl84]
MVFVRQPCSGRGRPRTRPRPRGRAEDRIRAARVPGLRNLSLHHTARNRLWLEIVQIALDLLAWMPMLALTGNARPWVPRRMLAVAGQLVTTGRRRTLRLARHRPWTSRITAALDGSLNRELRLTSRLPGPTTAPPVPESGTRRPPEATPGPLPRPPSAAERVMVRRLRQRTITKDRG